MPVRLPQMNPKERTVLVFLIAVALGGAAVSAWHHHRLQRNLEIIQSAIHAPQPAPDSTQSAVRNPQSAALIDLNTASAGEFDLLPGNRPKSGHGSTAKTLKRKPADLQLAAGDNGVGFNPLSHET